MARDDPFRAAERDVDAEHRALFDAVRTRDADTAEAALRTHFSRTMDVVMTVTRID